MQSPWRIVYYESSRGDQPIKEFIDSLEEKAKGKIYYTFELLKEFGIQLGAPHVKKLTGTPLWELRILGTDNLRIFYIAQKQHTFFLLHAFRKKTQKTERKEIKIAMDRLKEFP